MDEVAGAGRRQRGEVGLQLLGSLERLQQPDLAAAQEAEVGRGGPVHADAAPQPDRGRGVVVPEMAGSAWNPPTTRPTSAATAG